MDKMLGFIKKMFVLAISFFGYNVLMANSLVCILMNSENVNQNKK